MVIWQFSRYSFCHPYINKHIHSTDKWFFSQITLCSSTKSVEISPTCTNTSSQSLPPLANNWVNNIFAAVRWRLVFNQSLFKFVHVIDASLLYTLLHKSCSRMGSLKSGLFGGHRSVVMMYRVAAAKCMVCQARYPAGRWTCYLRQTWLQGASAAVSRTCM